MRFLEEYPHFEWDQPIYIIGNPRSGTSLFRLMLHLHPEIGIPPESHFFLWLEEKYKDWKFNRLDEYLDDLFSSTKFETWQVSLDDLRTFIVKQEPNNYAQLNSLIYLFYLKINGKQPRFWGDKNKLWKEKLDNILATYPKTKFIHIIRDGRDIVCSFRELAEKKITSKYAPKVPLDIEHLSERWNANIKSILLFQKKVNEDEFLTIRYEDMLRSSKAIMQKAFAFIGVSFEASVLDYYQVEDPDQVEPEEFFQWKEKLLHPPDLNNIGKYRACLAQEEITHFNTVNSNLLREFNYDL